MLYILHIRLMFSLLSLSINASQTILLVIFITLVVLCCFLCSFCFAGLLYIRNFAFELRCLFRNFVLFMSLWRVVLRGGGEMGVHTISERSKNLKFNVVLSYSYCYGVQYAAYRDAMPSKITNCRKAQECSRGTLDL